MDFVKKLSTKSIMGKITPPTETFEAYQIFGTVNKVRTDEGTYGTFNELQGSFAAVNVTTGEEFRAGKCFLPEVAENIILPAVQEEKGPVEFAFVISLKPNDAAAVGYEFTCAPMFQTQAADPMHQLKQRAQASYAQLLSESHTLPPPTTNNVPADDDPDDNAKTDDDPDDNDQIDTSVSSATQPKPTTRKTTRKTA